jgi:hypothetical protein
VNKVNICDKQIYKLPEGTSDREFSFFLDKKIGFNIEQIEKSLINKSSTDTGYKLGKSRSWIGLNPQIFQTPYNEFYDILDFLEDKNIQTVVDIGAAYGRLAFVLNAFRPEAKFYGHEFIGQRAAEANRLFEKYNLKNAQLLEDDIVQNNFKMAQADLYFIYDFSDPQDLRSLLEHFSKMWDQRKFFMVARGKALRSLIQNKYPHFHLCFRPMHTENWSIYSSFCDLAQR